MLNLNVHLKYLVNETWDARGSWQAIGRNLGIDPPTLECINSAKRGIPDDCYSEMLSTWLRQNSATWGQLLEVLRFKSINLANVADEVDKLSLQKKQEIGYC